MSHVFLSYASEDRERVRPLARLLEQAAPVWWDEKIRHGEQWEDVIERAVAEAGCIVVVWTADSVKSGWVKSEAADARDRGILVPVMLDAVTLPLSFRHIQTAHLEDWDGSARHPEAQELLSVVGEMMARNPAGAPAAPSPAAGHVAPAAGRKLPSSRARLALATAALVVLALGGYAALKGFGSSDRTVGPPAPLAKADSPGAGGAAVPDSDSTAPAEPDPADDMPANFGVGLLAPQGGGGGTQFDDMCFPRAVHVNAGWLVDGVQLDCVDGGLREQRGGVGGTRSTFTLEPGERITAVTVWPGTVVRGLQIHTDQRDSPIYGLDGDPARAREQGMSALRLEVPGGSVFLGFAGSEEPGKHIVSLGVKYGIETVFGN